MQNRYHRLHSEYAACRAIFSTRALLSNSTNGTLVDNISTFLATCRQEKVARNLGNIMPKLHHLEEHVVPCMDHFGMGLSLLGEQGMESIHAEINNLERKFLAIPSPSDRLLTCVEQHFLATLPQNAALRPKAVPRKRKAAFTDD